MARVASGALAFAGLTTAVALYASPASFTFTPPNGGFIPALNGGVPLTDVEGDTPGPRDIVGDANNPMLYLASDATHVYFRLRVDESPLQSATNFSPFGWGCFVNTDANLQTYEYAMVLDGVNNPDRILFYKNTATTQVNDPNDPPDLPPVSTVNDPLLAAVSHARVVSAGSNFGGTPDFFLDWAIDLSAALAVGFDPTIPSSYYCGSSNNGANIDADCSGSSSGGCPLDSQFSDPIGCGTNGCAVCGDGSTTANEGCDDGNLVAGDGCNAFCLKEIGQPCGTNVVCASGFCDPANNTCACDQDADCPTGQLCATTPNPNQCVNPGCGNFLLEGAEGCDDGNLNPGDGCNGLCLKELGEPCSGNAVCASTFCDPAGNICACDQNADCPAGQLCNTTPNPNVCTPAGCGNGVLEAGEGCDDNNLNVGDGCNSACLKEIGEPCTGDVVCASTFCDTANNTCACDQDNDCPNGQLCSTVPNPNQCVPPGCGNQVLELGEGCDDGNLSNSDGCNDVCLKELGEPCIGDGQCASSFCDPAGNICACDQSSDCAAGLLCNLLPNPNTCVAPGCGNGVLESGEGCDDGNLGVGDGCNAVCLKELGEPCSGDVVCASTFCDTDGGVCACDENADCPTGQVCDFFGQPNACVNAGCGNNVLETGEGCDDGNLLANDGCNAVCLLEIGEPCTGNVVCASTFCDPTDDTCECDQDADCPAGNQCNTTLNPNQCVPAGCGNMVLGAGEGCDDGNLVNGDGCSAQCLIEIGEPCTGDDVCDSGVCDPTLDVCVCDQDSDCPAGQLCDTAQMPPACVDAICGNGSIETGEGCDDQNTTAGDGCSATCAVEPDWTCMGEPSVCDPSPCSSDADCTFCNEQYSICVQACDQTTCPSGFFCDAVSGICVPLCTQDSECPGGHCDVATGNCAECVVDGDCALGETCKSGICGPGCSTAADCDGGAVCSGSPGICVECVVDADCGTDLLCIDEHCLPGCNEEADCNGVACNETIGVCVECTVDSDCPAGQECDEAYQQCFQVGCGTDADCPMGQVCDPTTHECVGCTEDADCPMGQVCDESTQTCVECTTDPECPNGEVCDESTQTCVECTSDAECSTGRVCDEGNHVCVECVQDDDCTAGFCDPAVNLCVECLDDTQCNGGTCLPESHTCSETPESGFSPAGGGCACTTTSSSHDGAARAVLGLLGLALARRRRRRD